MSESEPNVPDTNQRPSDTTESEQDLLLPNEPIPERLGSLRSSAGIFSENLRRAERRARWWTGGVAAALAASGFFLTVYSVNAVAIAQQSNETKIRALQDEVESLQKRLRACRPESLPEQKKEQFR